VCQKAKGKGQEANYKFHVSFAFCLLPFARFPYGNMNFFGKVFKVYLVNTCILAAYLLIRVKFLTH